MEYFRVKNWEHFQHYSKRNPPWIKLYTSLLDDFEFLSLSESARLLAFNLLMLAAKTGNKMPINEDWLKTRLLMVECDLRALFSYGLIEPWSASRATLAPCASVSRAEREERKKEPDDQKVVSEEERAKNRARFAELRETLRGNLKAMP